MALSELLQDLDTAITKAEELKVEAADSAKHASLAQSAYESACSVVLDLQAKLRDRLGPLLGTNGRVRGA